MLFSCGFYLVFGFCSVTLGHRFGYTPWEQRKWRSLHNSCGGQLQSPIRINSQQAIPLQMPALEMIRYHDLLPGPLELHNNGHSVSLTIAKRSAYSDLVPYIFGARLNNEYELEGLHFHWGNRNNYGSEHTFNDVRYPLEMHIIHRNRKYANVPEALKHRDGLTVLAFFYQIADKDNKGLAPVIQMFSEVEEYNTSTKINQSFPLVSLLPPPEDMERYYTYWGSLTTPPCSEAVTWILFPNPLPISGVQMNRFRGLQSDDKVSMLVNNYRSLQKIGVRRVFVRVLKPKGWMKYNSTVHYSKWDWLYTT